MPAGLAFTTDSGQTEAGRLYNCPVENETRAPQQKAIDNADYECARRKNERNSPPPLSTPFSMLGVRVRLGRITNKVLSAIAC